MRPTRTALLLALYWLGLGIATAFVRELQLPFLIAGGSLAVLALVDVITLLRRPPPTLMRVLPHVMAVGERYAVELSLHSDRKERVVVHDHAPATGVVKGLPATLELVPDRIAHVAYHFRPMSRGALRFPSASVLFSARSVCSSRSVASATAQTPACIRTSGAWRRTPAPAKPRCIKVPSCGAGAARARSFTSCASTARATRRARSTGRR